MHFVPERGHEIMGGKIEEKVSRENAPYRIYAQRIDEINYTVLSKELLFRGRTYF